MSPKDKDLVWLSEVIKTPPLSPDARLEAGYLLWKLQRGERLFMPHSRPMPQIGHRCHELRINDQHETWRIIYRMDLDAIIIVDVFAKRTNETPQWVIDVCKKRLKNYDS